MATVLQIALFFHSFALVEDLLGALKVELDSVYICAKDSEVSSLLLIIEICQGKS